MMIQPTISASRRAIPQVPVITAEMLRRELLARAAAKIIGRQKIGRPMFKPFEKNPEGKNHDEL